MRRIARRRRFRGAWKGGLMTSAERAGPEAGPVAEARLEDAARAAIAREERTASPQGEWRDRLWYPVAEERQACCAGIEPAPGNRQALESHCRTQGHVAHLFGVPLIDLRRAVQTMRRGRVPGRPARPPDPRPAVPAVGRAQNLFEVSQEARSESIRELHDEARQVESLLPRLLAATESDEGLLDLLAAATGDLDRLRFVVEYCFKLERAVRAAQEVRDMVLDLYGVGPESA